MDTCARAWWAAADGLTRAWPVAPQDADFVGTHGSMSGTMSRLERMSAARNGRFICYMVGLVVTIFVVIFFMSRTT